jgi:hypothetical protein
MEVDGKVIPIRMEIQEENKEKKARRLSEFRPLTPCLFVDSQATLHEELHPFCFDLHGSYHLPSMEIIKCG